MWRLARRSASRRDRAAATTTDKDPTRATSASRAQYCVPPWVHSPDTAAKAKAAAANAAVGAAASADEASKGGRPRNTVNTATRGLINRSMVTVVASRTALARKMARVEAHVPPFDGSGSAGAGRTF